MNFKRQFEEAVAIGFVLPPALLVNIESSSLDYQLIAVGACLTLLLLTVAGVFVFRTHTKTSASFLFWRALLAVTLCISLSFFGIRAAMSLGGIRLAFGITLGAVVVVIYVGIYSIRTGVRRAKTFNPRMVGYLSALGATVGALILGIMPDFAGPLLLLVLNWILAIVAGYVSFDFVRDQVMGPG